VVEIIAALALGGAIILAILYMRVRGALARGRRHHADWDEMMIKRLREQGYHPFNEYPVDYFLALRDEATCERVRARLEAQGFAVDVKSIEGEGDLPYSLHASRAMRLIVPDIQALSQRMRALAEEFQGRYDGWAA
jgi:regulator of RNase E activity RraB